MKTLNIKGAEVNFSDEEIREIKKELEGKPEKGREEYLSERNDQYIYSFNNDWDIFGHRMGGNNALYPKELEVFKIHLIFQKLVDRLHFKEFGIERYEWSDDEENYYYEWDGRDQTFDYGYTQYFHAPMMVYSKTKAILEKALSMLTEQEKDIYFNRK